MNGKESIKSLFWLVIAIILIGIDEENITGFPFLFGVGIIIYLFINSLILTSNENEQKEQ